MSLPLDDAQLSRHVFRQLCEQTRILDQELLSAGFHGPQREAMVKTYWDAVIQTAVSPDFAQLLREFMPPEEEL